MEELEMFFMEEEGVGVVEVILILVVLIAAVLIFKNKIVELVNNIFDSIETDKSDITG